MGTALIPRGGHHFQLAEAYYSLFKAEPILPTGLIQLPRVERVGNSLAAVVARMAMLREREVLIVSHGLNQLALPLLPGSRVGTDGASISQLVGDPIFGRVSDSETAQNIPGATPQAIRQLRASIADVQALSPRVEIRACAIGGNTNLLQDLKRLFNASSICAPTRLDAYGRISINPTPDAGTRDRWLRRHPNARSFGQAPDRFWWTETNGAIRETFAESDRAARAWVGAKFPSAGPTSYHLSSAPYHAAAGGGRPLVFPGDQEYRRVLARVL